MIHRIDPRFLFSDDKQSQYQPVMTDIGQRLRAGEWLPVIDPNLGPSGNYALDLQYGLYDPSHWLVAVGLSAADEPVRAAFIWSALFMWILATGVCALLLRFGTGGAWAAAGGVAMATSGFVLFWLAPSWMPGLVSLAWLPWWWWAVAGRPRPLALCLSAVFAFLTVAGGWPATWLLFAAATLGMAVEHYVRRQPPHAAAARLLATAAGGFAGLTAAVPLVLTAQYTAREEGVRNSGLLVTDLADILAFASPTLLSRIEAYGGEPTLTTATFFGGWFCLVLAWGVRWSRQAWLLPGFVTCAVGLAICLVLSQAPSDLGPFRNPIRVLPGIHLFWIVGILVVAARLGVVATRARMIGLATSVAVVGLLAWFRTPDQALTHLLGAMLLAGACVALTIAIFSTRPARTRPHAGGLVAGLLSVGLTGFVVATAPGPELPDSGAFATRADQTIDAGLPQRAVVLAPRGIDTISRYAQGVPPGFGALHIGTATLPGYSSVSQPGWRELLCQQTSAGLMTECALPNLLSTAPGTAVLWLDLLKLQTVIVAKRPGFADTWADQAPPGWEQVDESADFVAYVRQPPTTSQLPGRVGAIIDGEADVAPASVRARTQSYEVDAADGATLIFSDIYWPGYSATLDGENVEITPYEGLLVSVRLPPGSSGELILRYDPPGFGLRVGLYGLGGGCLATAIGLGMRSRQMMSPDGG